MAEVTDTPESAGFDGGSAILARLVLNQFVLPALAAGPRE
jgi:hypothetical protein